MTTRAQKRTGTRAPAGRRRGGPASRRGKEARGGIASRLPVPSAEEVEAAKRRYEAGVVSRGEAVPAGAPLTPGATHEIVGHTPDGRPILRRRRYSAR